MSLKYENTAVSNPGTVCMRAAGSSRISVTSTRSASVFRSSSRSGACSPTVRKNTSAAAFGGTTFGATPPLIKPIV
jgi:hypothetical protein